MFLRKLCRNSVVPTEQRTNESLVPTFDASLQREDIHSVRVNRENRLRLNQEQRTHARHGRALSPPPAYSFRNPHGAAGHRYEYATSTSSDEGNDVSTGVSPLRARSHCPDLLHSCSLILSSEQQSTSSVRSDRPVSLSSSDYVEIEELCKTFSQLNNNAGESEVRTTRHQEGECLTNSAEQAMGQNLSLRRPRISLTWVLRDQQQGNSTNTAENKGANEKKKFKGKNKDEKLFSEKYVSDHNLQEYQEKREPTKDLLFVCTPQKAPLSDTYGNGNFLERRRSDLRKNFEKRNGKVPEHVFEGPNEDCKSLKGTYSEPSLIAASEGNHRRHRHRKRRDRNRLQKFGYEIRNVDEFLSKCSLASPGNIPVVLASSSTLYQTRPGGYQIEIPLPLGMVVNAVFKNENWLYVQTPHAEEGYVGYSCCLPLGILPPAARANSTSRPPPCWETSGDVFPRPCGNMTDSEKEVRLRGGTRSDGARTPKLRRSSGKAVLHGEHHVDQLYLRAASQPKLTEKSYAQLKPVVSYRSIQQSKPQEHSHKNVVLQQKPKPAYKHAHTHGPNIKNLRQTLVAITNDYMTESVSVHKGEIVTLLECRETKDRRQWFYIRARDGREGFIPAEYAGHGFL